MPKVETFNKVLVLKQATEVFHDKGYNATSMQDLVDATGLNRSSIYNSFDSKLNLFLECLRYYEGVYTIKTSTALIESTNSMEAIEYIFELYLKEMLANAKGCLIVNCKSEMAHHNKSITQFLEKSQDSNLKLLKDLIVNGQENNVINSNRTVEEYALYLFSSLQGFRMTGILIRDREQLKSIIKTILQSII